MNALRPVRAVLAKWSIVVLVVALAGCGGGEADPVGGAGSQSGGGTAAGADTTNANADGGDAGDSSGNSTATLTVGGDVYTWTADQMTVCEINGVFGPANADFGVPPSQGGGGPWVQFIDRGDGGVNFSAVIDGEEYSGTGSGEADEIRPDGFDTSGSMVLLRCRRSPCRLPRVAARTRWGDQWTGRPRKPQNQPPKRPPRPPKGFGVDRI